MGEKVYKKRFSEETRNHMWGNCTTAMIAKVRRKQNLMMILCEAITRRLERVDIPDDYWEDIASDPD
jgi:hypothetical protein